MHINFTNKRPCVHRKMHWPIHIQSNKRTYVHTHNLTCAQVAQFCRSSFREADAVQATQDVAWVVTVDVRLIPSLQPTLHGLSSSKKTAEDKDQHYSRMLYVW